MDLTLVGKSHKFRHGYLECDDKPFIRKDYDGEQAVNFRGGSISLRAQYARQLTFMGGSHSRLVNGTLQVRASVPVLGSITEFSNSGSSTTTADQAFWHINSYSTVTPGVQGAAWSQQVSGVAVDPKVVRYVAVGTLLGTGSTLNRHYFKNFQVAYGPTYLNGDVGRFNATYDSPRKAGIRVKADRINWSTNPGLSVDVTDWVISGGLTSNLFQRRTSTKSRSGWAAGGTPSSGGSGSPAYFKHTVPTAYKDKTYTVSFYISTEIATAISAITFTGADVLVSKDPYMSVINGTVRYQFLVKPTGTTGFSFEGTLSMSGGVGGYVEVYDVLVEQGDKFDQPYFDGSTEGTDGIWEFGGTAGKTRSHYYKNRLERAAALKRILAENVPMGIAVASPSFGLLPSDIAPPVDSNTLYGGAVYGDGVYGGTPTT